MNGEKAAKVYIEAVDKTEAVFRRIGSNLQGFESRLSGLKTAFQALFAAAPFAALGAAISSVANQGEEFLKLSQAIGISVENLSGLKYAAELSETSLEALATGSRILAKSISGVNEEGEDVTQLLKKLGVTSKDPYTALLQLADAFEAMEDGAGKTAIAQKLLGRSGTELIAFLNQGSKGIREMQEELRRMGGVMSKEAAKAADELNDSIARLNASYGILKKTIVSDIMPNLTRMAGVLAGLATGNDELIAKTKIFDIETRIAKLREKQDAGGGWLVGKEGLQAEIDRLEAQKKELESKFPRLKLDQPSDEKPKKPAPVVDDNKKKSNKKKDDLQPSVKQYFEDMQKAYDLFSGYTAEQETKVTEITRKELDERHKKFVEARKNQKELDDAYFQQLLDEEQKFIQMREAEIELQLKAIDLKEQEFQISPAEATEKRITLYRDLLGIQESSLAVMNKMKDPASWYAQARAIEDTRGRLLELNMALKEQVGTVGEGFTFGLQRYVRAVNTNFQKAVTVTEKVTGDMERAFGAFFDYTSEGFFKLGDLAVNMLNSIANAMMQQFVVQTIVKGISGAVGSYMNYQGSGMTQGQWNDLAAEGQAWDMAYHNGGLVMHKGGYVPRFHFGGLQSDERLAINKVGERYITKEQNEWLTNLSRTMQGPENNGGGNHTFIINALDPQSWEDYVRRNPGPIVKAIANDARMLGPMRHL